MKGIIGAICGDIIGSTREFNPIKVKEFELVEEASVFTDDTVMTLAVANWLIKDDDYSKKILIEQLKSLGNSYPLIGYGRRFKEWLRSNDNKAYDSWGNGSAMRVSPVAWAADSLEEVQKLAKISAEVTHNHPEGIKGAQATASSIFLARFNASKEYIRDYIHDTYGYDLSRRLDDIRAGYKFEVSCQKSVPESIICFLESESYEDCIRNAISLGGDADTQAAISGAIASAFYDVPDSISIKCFEKLDVKLLNILYTFNNLFIENKE